MSRIVYNYAIVYLPDEDGNAMFDIYYFQKGYTAMNYIRVANVYMSFLVHRLPDMTINQTMDFISSVGDDLKLDFKYEIRRGLRDSSFNTLDAGEFEYIEIFSKSPDDLKKLHEKLYELLMDYYKYLNYERLNTFDKLFVRNTETPFRFTHYTINKHLCKYWFSSKFNLPFVGYMSVDTKNIKHYERDYLRPTHLKVEETFILDANEGHDYHNKRLIDTLKPYTPDKDYKTDENNNIVVASYDIETYNKNMVVSPTDPNQYIFCIGIAFFKLMCNKPYARYSLISADLKTDPAVSDKLVETDLKLRDILTKPCKCYIVNNEYCSDKDDYTTYICLENEVDLIRTYVELLHRNQPHIVTGFNNFTFDDTWIYSRVSNVDKFGEATFLKYRQVFSTYDIDELDRLKRTEIAPQWKTFTVKMEGKVVDAENRTMRAPVIQSLDVLKMLKKADPKRFSQRWKLDYMLEVYHIKNPYNGQNLSKTGLEIHQMFESWDQKKDLYEIAFYCLQDSWICATLIIERNNLIDKLAMATITYTSFEDSLYLADGHRVSCLNVYFSYRNDFATLDDGYKNRSHNIKHNWKYERGIDDEYDYGLGMKTFDKRTIVGGGVKVKKSSRHTGVTALDFSAQYPAMFCSENIASSSAVDVDMLVNPEKYGMKNQLTKEINDMFGPRRVYYLKRIHEGCE